MSLWLQLIMADYPIIGLTIKTKFTFPWCLLHYTINTFMIQNLFKNLDSNFQCLILTYIKQTICIFTSLRNGRFPAEISIGRWLSLSLLFQLRVFWIIDVHNTDYFRRAASRRNFLEAVFLRTFMRHTAYRFQAY